MASDIWEGCWLKATVVFPVIENNLNPGVTSIDGSYRSGEWVIGWSLLFEQPDGKLSSNLERAIEWQACTDSSCAFGGRLAW